MSEVTTRVRRNDWGALSPPPVGGWRPTKTISVIIPAYNCQPHLDLALAALSRQTYPSELLEVVVADDGSDPKLELPEHAPANCRLVRVPGYSNGWGRANALHVGVDHSTGEIIHWLDADLIPFPEHVEAQARWHHLVPDAVTLGYKRFVPDGWTTPAEVLAGCDTGTIDRLFLPDRTQPHAYVEELIDGSDQLRAADHLAFRAHVGATAALRRELYLAAGGLDTGLRLGEDSEFGYRLAQAGALFVPEPAAQSWHMGPSHMMTVGAELRRYNQPFLAERMAHPRWLRTSAGRTWTVPLVTAVVEVGDVPLELARACVDRLLTGDESDLHVKLVGDWDTLTDERRSVLQDPRRELRLIAATYQAEPRVQLVPTAPRTVFPSPYLLRVPVQLGVGRQTVRRLVTEADRTQAGLLRLLPPGAGAGVTPPTLELWRTSALSRARRHQRAGEPLATVVDETYGARWVNGAPLGVVDLSELPTDALRAPQSWSAAPSRTELAVVPVAGLRSLVRAARHVARLAAHRLGASFLKRAPRL